VPPITRYTTGLVRRYPGEMWEADDRRVTFRFTSPGLRSEFLKRRRASWHANHAIE
jgi:hypothetical protein